MSDGSPATRMAEAELRPNGPAIAALLFGVLAFLAPPLAPVAIACGIWSRRRLREYPDSAGGTITTVGLTLGVLAMVELAFGVLVLLARIAG